jgi:hypothetical protein
MFLIFGTESVLTKERNRLICATQFGGNGVLPLTLKIVQMTSSEQGGVVSDPLYLKW